MRLLNGILTLGVIFALVLSYYYIKEVVHFLYIRLYLKEECKLDLGSPLSMMNRNNDEGDTDKKLGFIMISIALISAFIAIIQITPFGVESIGHIIEKDQYITYYNGTLESHSGKDVAITAKLQIEDKEIIPLEVYVINSRVIEVAEYTYWGYGFKGFTVVFDEIEIIDEYGNEYWLHLLDEKGKEF